MNSAVTSTIAGAVGGLAGAAVKQVCEAIVPPRAPGREPPPGVLAEKIVRACGGDGLSKERKETVSLAVHWIFSTVTAAGYGAIVMRSAQAKPAAGVGFGIALWAGLHEITLPLLGATPPLGELPFAEQTNEFVNHSIFGATVEYVRAAVVRIANEQSDF